MERQSNSGDRDTGGGRRFVVLRHEGIERPHFDLMIDVDGVGLLATWQVREEPGEWRGVLKGVRIADHRRVYLAFEGEISGGRGVVKRVEEGTVFVLERGERWRVRLEGKRVSGEFWVERV